MQNKLKFSDENFTQLFHYTFLFKENMKIGAIKKENVVICTIFRLKEITKLVKFKMEKYKYVKSLSYFDTPQVEMYIYLYERV